MTRLYRNYRLHEKEEALPSVFSAAPCAEPSAFSFFDRFGWEDILLILLLILLFQQDEKDYLAMIAVGYLFFFGL